MVLKFVNASREVGSTPFKYVDHTSDFVEEMLTKKEMQSDFFEQFGKKMKSGLQRSHNCGITEKGMVFYFCFS